MTEFDKLKALLDAADQIDPSEVKMAYGAASILAENHFRGQATALKHLVEREDLRDAAARIVMVSGLEILRVSFEQAMATLVMSGLDAAEVEEAKRAIMRDVSEALDIAGERAVRVAADPGRHGYAEWSLGGDT